MKCELVRELQISSLHEVSSALGRPVNHGATLRGLLCNQAFTQSQRALLLTHQVKKNLFLWGIISLVCLMFYGVIQYLFTSPQENKHSNLGGPVFLCLGLNTFNTGLEIKHNETNTHPSTTKEDTTRSLAYLSFFCDSVFLKVNQNPAQICILTWTVGLKSCPL